MGSGCGLPRWARCQRVDPDGVCLLQAIEHAFKNETVGLVTREQFVEKRLTIEERLKEEEKRQRHEAEEEALRVGGLAHPGRGGGLGMSGCAAFVGGQVVRLLFTCG